LFLDIGQLVGLLSWVLDSLDLIVLKFFAVFRVRARRNNW